MPGPEARPAIGQPGELEFVDEDRVEVIVNDKGQREEIKKAIKELKTVSILFITIHCCWSSFRFCIGGTPIWRSWVRCVQARGFMTITPISYMSGKAIIFHTYNTNRDILRVKFIILQSFIIHIHWAQVHLWLGKNMRWVCHAQCQEIREIGQSGSGVLGGGIEFSNLLGKFVSFCEVRVWRGRIVSVEEGEGSCVDDAVLSRFQGEFRKYIVGDARFEQAWVSLPTSKDQLEVRWTRFHHETSITSLHHVRPTDPDVCPWRHMRGCRPSYRRRLCSLNLFEISIGSN